MSLETGQVLGRWTLERKLGEGAMGPVFEAVSTGRTRGALHAIRSDLVAEGLERFRRDAKTFQKIDHPNVPRLLDLDEANGQAFLVFEIVDGRSLQFRLDKKEPLSPEEARNLATDLLSALAILHDRGVVHGDVKPASVLAGPEGYWKLTGFSILPREPAPPGVPRGAPLFMPPERCQGGPETPTGDLYSAGVTIYAALTGEPPFLRPSVAAILDAHVKDAPQELSSRVPGLEKDLLQLVELLMAKTPGKRPQDARTALGLLKRRDRPRTKTLRPSGEGELPPALADAPVLAPTPPAPPGSQTARRKAHEYVEERRRHEERKSPAIIAWGSALLPLAGAALLGAAAYFAPQRGLSARAQIALAASAGVAALVVLLRIIAGTVPSGLTHHAIARTLLDRALLRLSVAWNRRRNPARAAQALAELGEFEAGELLLDAGEPLLAAEEFLRAGIPLAAAIVLEKVGDAERAIDAYVAAGKLEDAMRAAESSGKLEEAGQVFERAGHLDEALKAYGRAGRPLPLALIYERQGKLAEAARHFELANQLLKAAELYENASLPAEAARLFHRAGDLARVAAVWEKAGDAINAARWRAERELAEGRLLNAAREFERAGMHGRAADLFLTQNLLPDAIRCAEADGGSVRRALLHARAGDFKKAAACHEEAGQHREAARCYDELGDAPAHARALERAGAALEAAEVWLGIPRPDEARRVLSSLPRGASERRRAFTLLGELEANAGRPREAAQAFAEALESAAPDKENVATFVACADALAACGEVEKAIERLLPLRGLDFAPPTARIRLAQLEARRRDKAVPVAPAAPREGKDLAGFDLDRYRAVTFTAEGELSWAYEAEHLLLKRAADLWVLKPQASEPAAKRFFAEGRALAVARHPNLPEVHDGGRTAQGLAYVALEVARDPSLRQLLRQARGALPVARAATIGAGILAGLAAAHEAGVVHGDLKPENVLVAPLDEVRIVGFSFARPKQAAAARTYVAPEQSAGGAAAVSDQFSCGVILFEMLAGLLPDFSRPLSDVAPSVPKPLAAAVTKALARRPDDRHASAAELQRIVARFATVGG